MKRLIEWVDRLQRRHAWLAFPVAVGKKFGDDRAGHLAALVAYYGFFSMFPLLLVLVTLLAIVLQDHPELRAQVLDTALTQFPVIGDQIRENLGEIKGSGLALGVGIGTAVWAGLGVTGAFQRAMDEVWGVPIKDRAPFLIAKLRGLLLLGVLGTLTLVATFLAGLGGTGGSFSGILRVAGFAGGLLVNLALFLFAFRALTRAKITVRDVFPGAVVAAVTWVLLQALGGYLVSTRLRDASETYGVFGFVIALLVWLYLGAQMTLYAAEINVVRARRLWPRSLVDLKPEDRRALEQYAKVEERRPDESVDVTFTDPPERADSP